MLSNNSKNSLHLFLSLFVSFLFLNIVCFSCSGDLKPVLDAMVPNHSFEKMETQIRVLGNNLPKKAKFFLLGDKGIIVKLSFVRWVSEKEVEISIPKDAPRGQFDLQLQLDSGENILLGSAFEILPSALIIYAINVGQGDATLLISPEGKTMLIDAGKADKVSAIRVLLKDLGISKIDHILATHYDSDHVGGFAPLFKGVDGQFDTDDDIVPRVAIWDYGGWSKSSSYAQARQHYANLHRVLDGQSNDSFPSIDLGGGVFVDVMTTNGVVFNKDTSRTSVSCGRDTNCRSIGTLIRYGKFRMWTAGDLTGGGNGSPNVEAKLTPNLSLVDVYHAHHHGSKTGSSEAFLKKINPQVVVISAGQNNSYCHPSSVILERLLKLSGLSIFLTSAGISNPDKCGGTTQKYLSPIGKRAVIDAGDIRISAERDHFSISLTGRTDSYKWQTR